MEKIYQIDFINLLESFKERIKAKRRRYSIKKQMENGLFNKEIIREIKKLKTAERMVYRRKHESIKQETYLYS